MPAVLFHLHGKSPSTDGISISLDVEKGLEHLRKTVAAQFSVALPSTLSFHKSAPPDTTPSDLQVLATTEAVQGEGTVALLVSAKRVRPVPSPTGGIPFIGGYSELYPDFMGNYQRLLTRYGHIVHVSYLGKSVYLTDDPDCAGIVVGANHPLFPLKMTVPNGLFTADSANPAIRKKGTSVDAFAWGLRAAGQTIGEVAVGVDFKMLDSAASPIAAVFRQIGAGLHLAQILFRKGAVYRALPNPEARAQRGFDAQLKAWVDEEVQRTLREYETDDMPRDEAALKSRSLLDYMLHATDEEGRKMEVELVHQNVLTFLGAGQVTTSSALAWLWFCVASFPEQARKLYASLIAAGLRADTQEITAEELGKLEYLDWFIKETQRLYNPAFQPTRQAHKDVIMPGGLLVPAGAQVTVALHSLMVNPEHWKDPLTFEPDRWGTEAVRKRHKNAYLPFAAGARGCIGFNFALQEIKIILCRVVLNFQIENTTEGAVIYDPDFSLFRPLNFNMRLHRQVDPAQLDIKTEDKTEEKKLQASQPLVGTKTLPRFWAVHASDTGTCAGMAGILGAKAQQLGFADVQVVALADSPLASAEKTAAAAAGPNFFVVCVATYNGEPPAAALGFCDMLDVEMTAGDSARFSGINFCVFGAGNTQWGPTFQAFPKKVDVDMAALGGNRIFEKGTGDSNGDQDGDFTEWTTKLWAATAANFGVDIKSPVEGGGNLITDAPEYSAESVKLEFLPRSSSAAETFLCQPPIAGFVKATVSANVELVDEDTPMPRCMRLLTFDVPEDLPYREGDHIEVVPENKAAVVDRLLIALNFVADAVFSVNEVDPTVNPTSLAALLVGRGQITLRDLLLYYADLAGPLQRSGVQMLASFLPPDDKFKSLQATLTAASSSSDKKDAVTSFTQQNRNFSDLVTNYPLLSQALNLQKLLMVLRATQPRRYSVASSPLVDARVVKLCVGVDDERVSDFQGLCSGFLRRVDRACRMVPVTMVGAGTGISAYLGFLEHRRAQGIKIPEFGGEATFRLVYGTSHHDMASLKSLIRTYVKDGTVLAEAAYSADDSPYRFAQHILIRDGLKIWTDLSNNGRVYVCGSAARVGEGVRQSLMRIAEQVGGVSDPTTWLAGLRKEGRYSEDVFG
ncbi:cytochrome P450 [Mycena polygramma]|nr:cytochrome P450 [Mycena polygramma]